MVRVLNYEKPTFRKLRFIGNIRELCDLICAIPNLEPTHITTHAQISPRSIEPAHADRITLNRRAGFSCGDRRRQHPWLPHGRTTAERGVGAPRLSAVGEKRRSMRKPRQLPPSVSLPKSAPRISLMTPRAGHAVLGLLCFSHERAFGVWPRWD